jgi:hypothetical protein
MTHSLECAPSHLSAKKSVWRKGETVKRKQKPWEAIGMSRASWYRYGKPTAKPSKPMMQREIARKVGVSLRTAQRITRVLRIQDQLPAAERSKLVEALKGASQAHAVQERLAIDAIWPHWRSYWLGFGVFPGDPEYDEACAS